jgi:hypothetical protein
MLQLLITYEISIVLQAHSDVRETIVDPGSGRAITAFTTEPGLKFYTGSRYTFCLETQHFPDSPHHANFPTTVLRPGHTLHLTTIFSFSIACEQLCIGGMAFSRKGARWNPGLLLHLSSPPTGYSCR